MDFRQSQKFPPPNKMVYLTLCLWEESHPGQTRPISSHRHNVKYTILFGVVIIQARLDQFLPIDITLNTPSCSVEGIFVVVVIQARLDQFLPIDITLNTPSHPGQTRPISSHRHNVKYTILFGGGNFCSSHPGQTK